MDKAAVCVMGACNMDLISYVPRLPTIGETLHGTKFQTGFGGKGSNQAAMSAMLDVTTRLISKVGADSFGESFRKHFSELGLDISNISVTSLASTGVAPIAVDPHGANAIIIVGGANDLITEADIEHAHQAIESAQVLVVQLEVPVAPTLAALRLARARGVVTLLNTAPARPDLPDELFREADIVRTVVRGCIGLPVKTENDLRNAAAALIGRGPASVLLTVGSRGAALCTGPDDFEVVSVGRTVNKVVDTTGDAFVGTFAAVLAVHLATLPSSLTPREHFLKMLRTAEGRAILHRCVGRANWAASMSVEKEGTQCSYPTINELPTTFMELSREL